MPRGVRGSGKAAPKRPRHDEAEAEAAIRETIAAQRSPDDKVPRCRIAECGAMLAPGGQCPACTFRAKKYGKLFEVQNPNCECGAPKRPVRPGARILPRRCPICRKLHARAKAKGLTV